MALKMQNLLEELKESLTEIYGKNLSGVYLYGSYARRQEDHESDVDIVIVLKNFNDYWEEIKRTSLVISRLSLKYNISISPIRVLEEEWDQANSPFLNIVRKESVPV